SRICEACSCWPSPSSWRPASTGRSCRSPCGCSKRGAKSSCEPSPATDRSVLHPEAAELLPEDVAAAHEGPVVQLVQFVLNRQELVPELSAVHSERRHGDGANHRPARVAPNPLVDAERREQPGLAPHLPFTLKTVHIFQRA